MLKKHFSSSIIIALSLAAFCANAKKTPEPPQTSVGQHVIAEFWGCKNMFDTEKEMEHHLKAASEHAQSTLLKTAVYKFEPQGVTGLALLAESHISMHTWPETGYVAIDVFTCGKTQPHKAIHYLREQFQPERAEIKEIERGGAAPQLATRSVQQLDKDPHITLDRDTHLRREGKEFGYELVLNLYDCDLEAISTKEKLLQFKDELCELIDMKQYGEPFIEYFAEHTEFAAGYSLAQMIETSLISGHFSDYWRSAYINIFSCKPYDVGLAIEFTKKFFGAERVTAKLLVR